MPVITGEHSVSFRSELIGALLAKDGVCETDSCGTALDEEASLSSTPRALPSVEVGGVTDSGCDVAYILFLEPDSEESGKRPGPFEQMITSAIHAFTPEPTLVHCEVLLPPVPDSAGRRIHFATYMGQTASWQNRDREADDGISFYLIDNASRWRAVPIFGRNAVESLRLACDANVNSPYSISRYLTSMPVIRGFANILPDSPGSAGHCATLTARVLSESRVGPPLQHASAWYSPGTLYKELWTSLKLQRPIEVQPDQAAVSTALCEPLLRAPLSYAHVQSLGDTACRAMVQHLTTSVVDARAADSVDRDETSRTSQKDLARGLLRWVLLRKDD